MRLAPALLAQVAFGALLAFGPPSATRHGQPPSLRVVIVDSATRRPLENAEVLDLGSSRVYFANGDGVAFVQWADDKDLRLRVREIGYRPLEIVVKRSSAQAQSEDVALSRAVFTFDPLEIKTPCGGAAREDSGLPAAALLAQIRAAAERFDEFRKVRPFRVRLERVTSKRVVAESRRMKSSNEETNSDRWGEKYQPGSVLIQSGFGFSSPFLFVSSLGDTVFWANHCFESGGREEAKGQTVFRLNFNPVPSLKTVDWAGTAMLDSATGSHLRIEFRLVGLTSRDDIARLDGYTTFVPVVPFIQVPDSSVAGWWYNTNSREPRPTPDVVQLIHLVNVHFR